MVEAAWRVVPDYARRHAHEFYSDGISTSVSETIGSVAASSSNAMPSSIATPLPNPTPTPLRPAIDKPVAKLGPTATFTFDVFQSVVSAQARTAKPSL
eukprot:1258462-Lingulodinium_polyedra.AAC.1